MASLEAIAWGVRLRWLVLIGLCVAGTGCSELLGLGNLEFDRAPQAEVVDGGLSSAGTNGADSGFNIGVITDTFPEPNLYPALWSEQAIVVHDPSELSNGIYRVYEPESGVLSTVSSSETMFDIMNTYDWRPGWSLVVQVPAPDGSPALIGYDTTTGLAEYVTGLDEGNVHAEGLAGTPGWTHMLALPVDGTWSLLSYSSETGRFRFGVAAPARLLPDDAGQGLVVGQWTAGFRDLAYLPLAGEDGVLSFDSKDRIIEWHPLPPEDSPGEALDAAGAPDGGQTDGSNPEGVLGGSWTRLGSFGRNDDKSLVLYDEASGAVTTGHLTLGATLSFQLKEESAWRAGISTIAPLWLGSEALALTFSDGTGVLQVTGLAPLKGSFTAVR